MAHPPGGKRTARWRGLARSCRTLIGPSFLFVVALHFCTRSNRGTSVASFISGFRAQIAPRWAQVRLEKTLRHAEPETMPVKSETETRIVKSKKWKTEAERQIVLQGLKTIGPTMWLKKADKKNPRMLKFQDAREYNEMIDLLLKLEKLDLLEDTLKRGLQYWDQANVWQLMNDDRLGRGAKVTSDFRKDWPNIWPTQLDDLRVESFETFVRFWNRLGQSRLADLMLREVLPTIQEGTGESRLEAMPEDERKDVLRDRMDKCIVLRQYAKQCEQDSRMEILAPKMKPFFEEFVFLLERKLGTKAYTTEDWQNIVVFSIFALIFAGTFFAAGELKLPSLGGDAPKPLMAKSSVMLS